MTKKTKICVMCGKRRKISSFCKNKNSSDGFGYRCRECRRRVNAENYEKNGDKIRNRANDYYHSHKGEVLDRSIKYINPEHKICPKCNEVRHISEFYKDKRSSDGLNCYCKKCIKEISDKHEKFNNNPPRTTGYKVCSKCGKKRHVKNFPRKKRNKDGLSSDCFTCRNKRAKKHTESLNYERIKEGTKKCCCCGVTKDVSEFQSNRRRIGGLDPYCRECRRIKYQEGKKKKEITRFFKVCSSCGKTKKYTSFHKSNINQDGLTGKCKKCFSEQRSEYFQKNKKKIRIHINNKRHTNIQFRLANSLRTRIRTAIKNYRKGTKKPGSAVHDLGCTIYFLVSYLESKFTKGMTWDNYGFHGWHIDHIIPLDNFDLTDRDQFVKAVHYSNLQPLWKKDNLSKGNRLAA